MVEAHTPADPGSSTSSGSPPAIAPESEASFSSKARRSTFWTTLNFAGGQLIRFGGNLVLTRIFAPEIFGLTAMLSSFNAALMLFSEVGLHQNIVQSERGDDPSFLNTAWTIQVLRGAALWIIAAAVAIPMAHFYGEPLFSKVLPAYALSLVILGFNSTKLSIRHRRLEFGVITMIDLGCQVLTFVLTVIWAHFETPAPTVWAIVIATLIGQGVRMLLSHLVLEGLRNRFHWEKEAASSLFHFGKWITVSTIIHFFGEQGPPFIFKKLVSFTVLGVYSIGLQIAILPPTVAGALAYDVTFALYSRVRLEGGDVAPVYRRCRWLIMVATGWMLAGLCAGGPTIIRMLYDERYTEGGIFLSVLAIGSWFTCILNVNGAALLALGHPAWNIFPALAKVIAMAALIPVGYELGGFPGAVAGLAAADFIKYLTSTTAVGIAGLKERGQDVKLTLLLFGSAFLGWLAARGIHMLGLPYEHGPTLSNVLDSAVIFIVVTLCWLPYGGPELWHYLLKRKQAQ